MSNDIVRPNWPVASHYHAYTTLRSRGPAQLDFNLATHIGDAAQQVAANRAYLCQRLALPEPPRWLQQVHGTRVVHASQWRTAVAADALYTNQAQQVCAVLTADCLPILLAGDQEVAAIHAGWRGLAAGIVVSTLACFTTPRSAISAWLGPAISAKAFVVGEEVKCAFAEQGFTVDDTFIATSASRYFADLSGLATQQLRSLGVTQITPSNYCTYGDAELFFSYRREGNRGRMASLIWFTQAPDGT